MVRLFTALLVCLVAQPALALSCLRPDAVRLYEMARDSDDLFVMVRGKAEVTGAAINLVPDNTRDQTATTTAVVSGTLLTSHAFGRDFNREITLEVSCLGPWCGGTDGLEREQFLAIQVREDDLVLRLGPCGGDVVNWDRDGERRMLSCHRGGACDTGEF